MEGWGRNPHLAARPPPRRPAAQGADGGGAGVEGEGGVWKKRGGRRVGGWRWGERCRAAAAMGVAVVGRRRRVLGGWARWGWRVGGGVARRWRTSPPPPHIVPRVCKRHRRRHISSRFCVVSREETRVVWRLRRKCGFSAFLSGICLGFSGAGAFLVSSRHAFLGFFFERGKICPPRHVFLGFYFGGCKMSRFSRVLL